MLVIGDNPGQAMCVEVVLELVRIGGGDGGNIVGGINGPLHQVDVPVVGQHVLIEISLVEPEEILEGLTAVAPLILNVVYGKDALGVAELGNPVALLQQVDGYQRGLPVIAVNHVGMPVQISGSFNDSTGEIGKTLSIVIVAVNTGALEVILVVHKVVGDPVLLQFKKAAVWSAPGQLNVITLEKGHLTAPVVSDPLIQRENDPHIMPGLGQSLRQAPGYIGQSAGLDKGGDF